MQTIITEMLKQIFVFYGTGLEFRALFSFRQQMLINSFTANVRFKFSMEHESNAFDSCSIENLKLKKKIQ